MAHESNRAQSALNVRTLNTFSKKEITNMNRTAPLTLLALVLALAGCSNDLEGTEASSITPSASLEYPAVCESAASTKPEFCSAALPLTISMDLGDTAPYRSTQEFDRSAGDLAAEVTFAPLPTTTGWNRTVQVDPGFTLPAGYELQTATGAFNNSYMFLEGDDEYVVALRIVDVRTGNTGSGFGNVTLTAVDSEGTAVTGCGWNFNSDQLDTTCTVNADGATCNAIARGFYTVDVKCQDGALVKVGYGFEAIEDDTTAYTVIVAPPGSTGSGFGDLCVRTTDANNVHVDETSCQFFVDGVLVNPDDDADEICDGALLADLAAKTVEVKAVCGSEEGSMTTEVAEDTVTEVSITVTHETQPSTEGGVCFDVTKDGGPADNCTFDFDTIVVDPAPSSTPPASCTGAGKYHFVVQAGSYQIAVTCDSATVASSAEVSAENEQYVPVNFPDTTVTAGNICSQKPTMGLDLDTMSYDMGQWLGFGESGSCALATPQELATMSVTAFSHLSGPGSCVDMDDSDCAISVAGLVVSMKPSGFAGFDSDEKAYFSVTITDGNTSVDVVIVAKNGYFQP